MGESIKAIFCAVLKSDRVCSSSLSTGVETPDAPPTSKDVRGWIPPFLVSVTSSRDLTLFVDEMFFPVSR
jgi:hypothetical protein